MNIPAKHSGMRECGFGMLEIMVVLAIITLLGAISIPIYRNYSANAEASEIVLIYDSLRTGIASALNEGPVSSCESLLGSVGAARDRAVSNHSARVSIGFDAVGGQGLNGYTPVMLVCGRQDTQGTQGLNVARAAYEELEVLGRVNSGSVSSDTIVSFSAPLSDFSTAACRVPVGGTVDACGRATATPTAATLATPGLAAQPAVVAPTPQQIQVPKVVAPVLEFAGSDVYVRPDGSGRLDTGGDLTELSLEMSFIGDGNIPAASGGAGPVMFNYGDASNSHNALSLWNPRSLTVALAGRDYDTGIDVVDGQTHRVTVSWNGATGTLDVYDNGQLVRSFSGVATGQTIAGDGFMVIGHKGEPGQYNAAEAFAGQVFHTSFARSAVTAAEAANPIANSLDTSSGLLIDVRARGTSIVETTGRQQVVTGGVTSVLSNVDASLVQ